MSHRRIVLLSCTASSLLLAAVAPAPASGAAPSSAASGPVITRIDVHAGTPHGGTQVRITGDHFGALKSVEFGGKRAREAERDGTGTIRAVTPTHAPGLVHIRIVTSHGSTAENAASRFVYFAPSQGGALTFAAAHAVRPTEGGGVQLACPAVNFCVDADYYGNVSYFDGTSWSRAHKVDDSLLLRPSCVSRTFCMALDSTGRSLRFDGASWTNAHRLFPDDPKSSLQISCGTANLCLALADNRYRYYDGSTWSASRTVPGLPPGADLAGVSCGPTRCVAGTTVPGSDTPAELLAFDGSSWTDLTQYRARDTDGDFTAPQDLSCPTATFCAIFDEGDNVSFLNGAKVSGTKLIGDELSRPYDISCTSPKFCMLVNEDDDATAAIRYDGTSWRGVAGQQLNDDESEVSCASPTFCVVGANYLARVYRGGALSRGQVALPTTGLLDSSCPVRGFCLTTAGYGTSATFDGSHFGAPRTVVPSADFWTYVSCASKALCAEVSGTRAAVRANGSWRTAKRIDNRALTDVACGSAGECIAVDDKGRVVRYDGTRWHGPTAVDTRKLISVACSRSVCAAVDDAGMAVVREHGVWSRVHNVFADTDPTRGGFYGNVSCGSPTMCVISSDEGTVAKFDGTRWHRPVGIAYTDNVHSNPLLDTVDCPSATYCIAAESSNHTLTFDGSTWSDAHRDSTPHGHGPTAFSCATAHWCLGVVDDDDYLIARR